MKTKKALITLIENDVAPRFDLATEVLIASVSKKGSTEETRTLVLAHASAEDLCQLILDEKVDVVICGGIEEEYYDYLIWKDINVVDSVAGPWRKALDRLRTGTLKPGDILCGRPEGKDHSGQSSR